MENPDGPDELPGGFAAMISAAERIGAGFDHIRVDLYSEAGRVWFGETTMYPSSGHKPMARRSDSHLDYPPIDTDILTERTGYCRPSPSGRSYGAASSPTNGSIADYPGRTRALAIEGHSSTQLVALRRAASPYASAATASSVRNTALAMNPKFTRAAA